MNLTALILVLAGAALHATWNIQAKKCAGGTPFVFLFGVVSLVAAAPVALWQLADGTPLITTPMWVAIIGSALVHVLYSLVLQAGYRASDFSVVYPIARGTGPLIAVLASILFFHEAPGAIGWIGIGSILTGVYIFAGGLTPPTHDAAPRRRAGVFWGTCTGTFIACYTILDAWAVKSLGMDPVLFYAAGLAVRTALLAPFALAHSSSLAQHWRTSRRAIVIVGVLSPFAYLLVLFAMQLAPVSFVAPTREISMLIGTVVGARLLNESIRPAQIGAAALMLAGVAAIALA